MAASLDIPIQLRWAKTYLDEHLHGEPSHLKVLQYRVQFVNQAGRIQWSAWKDVPTEVQ